MSSICSYEVKRRPQLRHSRRRRMVAPSRLSRESTTRSRLSEQKGHLIAGAPRDSLGARYSLAWRAMFKRSKSFSRWAASLMSTWRSWTASTTWFCSSSTWKLKRRRRARWKSARFRVISILRESSLRPLLDAAGAGAGVFAMAWLRSFSSSPRTSIDPFAFGRADAGGGGGGAAAARGGAGRGAAGAGGCEAAAGGGGDTCGCACDRGRSWGVAGRAGAGAAGRGNGAAAGDVTWGCACDWGRSWGVAGRGGAVAAGGAAAGRGGTA